jgi:hypothetical protein
MPAATTASASCKHEFPHFGDQVSARRCLHCNKLESTTASASGEKRFCSVCGVVEGGYHQGECTYIGVVTQAECRTTASSRDAAFLAELDWCITNGVASPGMRTHAALVKARAVVANSGASHASNAGEDTALDAVEEKAKEIYAKFPGSGSHPWIEGGNSLMQDRARDLARAAIASSAPGGSDAP